jgi:GT2 family glycosyltransferase
MVDLSVIIVSWNAKDYLAKCLRSIEQTRGELDLEVIVADNASSDGSDNMVESDFPWVRLIRTGANLGFAKGNNVAIRAGSGRYFALVNSDVEVLPDCFQNLIRHMDAHPEIGLGGPRVLNADGSLQVSARKPITLWTTLCQAIYLHRLFPRSAFFSHSLMEYWDHKDTRKVSVLSGCFWIARSEALDRVGLLDESFFMYGEDVDWCLRFAKGGWEVVLIADAQAIHYGGGSSRNFPVKYYLEMRKAQFRCWRKYHAPATRPLFWLVSFLHELIRVKLAAVKYTVKPAARKTEGFRFRRHLRCLGWLLSGK